MFERPDRYRIDLKGINLAEIFDLKNCSLKYCIVDPTQLSKYPGFQNIRDLDAEVIAPIQNQRFEVCFISFFNSMISFV